MKILTRNSQKGFSLVEILVAIGILAPAMLFSITTISDAYMSLTSHTKWTQAVLVAHGLMDALIVLPEADTRLQQGVVHQMEFNEATDPLPVGDADAVYRAEWSVQRDAPTTGVMTVRLRVYWEKLGLNQGITVESYRSQE